MKVSEALQLLSVLHPDEDIIMLMWSRSDVDNLQDDELQLAPDKWSQIVSEFEEADDLGDSIHDWVTASVLEYAEFEGDETVLS